MIVKKEKNEQMVLKFNSLNLQREVRLTGNDRKVLKILIRNSRAKDVDIGEKLNISPQAAFKIRRKLESTGIIKNYSTEIDHEKIGIHSQALIMMDILDQHSPKLQELQDFMSTNLLYSSKLLINSSSYVALFGFENMQKLYYFFNQIQYEYRDIIKLNNIYTLHMDGFFKHSSKDLFYKTISEWGKEKTPSPPKLEYYDQQREEKETKKLSPNEKTVLKLFLDNGRSAYKQLSETFQEINLSDRGISKIKERLEKKEIIKGYTVELDYNLLGINVFALVFIEKKPEYWGLKEGLSRWAEKAPNILGCYPLNENSLHAVFCGFRNLQELEQYWANFEKENKEYIGVKNIYISSHKETFKPQMNFYEEALTNEKHTIR